MPESTCSTRTLNPDILYYFLDSGMRRNDEVIVFPGFRHAPE